MSLNVLLHRLQIYRQAPLSTIMYTGYADGPPYINLTECVITQITSTWTLATLYKLETLYMKLFSEHFLTHIKGKRTLATIY